MNFVVIFMLVAFANCQQLATVTEDLHAAQRELTIGHEFAEIFLVHNRERLSSYLEHMELEILHSFMEAYAKIKNTGIATREIMEEFTEPSVCFDRIRARWELQVTRYGSRLSQCLDDSNRFIKAYTQTLNDLHDQGRVYKVIVPNAGVQVLTNVDYRQVDHLGQEINNRARDLFFRAQDARRDFEEYVGELSLMHDEYIRQLTSCMRSLPRSFENESNQDLEAIRNC